MNKPNKPRYTKPGGFPWNDEPTKKYETQPYGYCINFEDVLECIREVFREGPDFCQDVFGDLIEFIEETDLYKYSCIKIDTNPKNLDLISVSINVENPNYEQEFENWKEKTDRLNSEYEKELDEWTRNEKAWSDYMAWEKHSRDENYKQDLKNRIQNLQDELKFLEV
jgi:hypothetical protein